MPELLIIAGVIILLFGAKKLPEMARSLGKSAKAFKEETKSMRGGDDAETPPTPAQPVAQQQLPQAQPPAPDFAPPVNGSQPTEQAQQNKNAS